MKLHYNTLDRAVISENIKIKELENRSGLHLEARNILNRIFNLAQIFEEVPVKLYSKKPYIYFDFFIPINRLFIEVQGEQHYKYTSMFHKNKTDFLRAQRRDRDKLTWCELNEYRLIYFNFNEREKWMQLIT